MTALNECVGYLITSGAGFIGANSVHYWLKNHPNDRVVVVDALAYAWDLTSLDAVQGQSGFRFVHGDIGESTATRITFVEDRPGHDMIGATRSMSRRLLMISAAGWWRDSKLVSAKRRDIFIWNKRACSKDKFFIFSAPAIEGCLPNLYQRQRETRKHGCPKRQSETLR